jgi:hypothetical protein
MSYTRLAMETDMSLNNKPLTDLEKTGLIKHGLPTDKHSQLSDAFRLGMEWALKEAGLNHHLVKLLKLTRSKHEI